MKRLNTTWCVVCLLLVSCGLASASPISKEEVDEVNEIHERWWGKQLVWRYADLPKSGSVDGQRMPWSGHIYPDRSGGCIQVLRRYDAAFNGRRRLASNFERHDIEIHKKTGMRRGGLFGRRLVERRETPDWAGHCNGWTAAAIRHAEPVNSVVLSGMDKRAKDQKR